MCVQGGTNRDQSAAITGWWHSYRCFIQCWCFPSCSPPVLPEFLSTAQHELPVLGICPSGWDLPQDKLQAGPRQGRFTNQNAGPVKALQSLLLAMFSPHCGCSFLIPFSPTAWGNFIGHELLWRSLSTSAEKPGNRAFPFTCHSLECIWRPQEHELYLMSVSKKNGLRKVLPVFVSAVGMKIYDLIQMDFKKIFSYFFRWMICLVTELVTLCSCFLHKWLLLSELISQERADDVWEVAGRVAGEYSEFLAGVCCCCLWVGTRAASVRSRSPPPPLEKMKTWTALLRHPGCFRWWWWLEV